MKSEFNILFESILDGFSDGQAAIPTISSSGPVGPLNGEVEITVEEGMSGLDIAEELLKQIKGLRKIARENGFDSKIYYRARNIDKLAKKLKVMNGGSLDESEDSDDAEPKSDSDTAE
jgi:hypothetical protein